MTEPRTLTRRTTWRAGNPHQLGTALGLALAVVVASAVATSCGSERATSPDSSGVSAPSNPTDSSPNTSYIGGQPGPSDPVGPAGIVRPPSESPPSTDSAGNPITPGASTIPNSPTTPPQSPTTVEEFARFRCVVSVTPYVGGTSGASRRVKVAMQVSPKTIPIVWVTTSWDESSDESAVTLNPDGKIEFLVFAPGSEWPRAQVFATPDRRATSQMCSSN